MDNENSNEEKYMAGLIRVTGSLVFLMGLFCMMTILSTRPTRFELADAAAAAAVGPSRAPSSLIVGTNGESAGELKERMTTIDLGCATSETASPERQVQVKWLRIRGKLCGHLAQDVKETTIMNRTSGIAAVVFPLVSAKSYTSDFFPLGVGENRIWVHHVLNSGETKLTELKVLRQ